MKKFAQQALCLLMIASILNTSIDVPDNLLYAHLAKSKIHAVNEVESVVELFAEFIFDADIKFIEQRNDDNDSNQMLKKNSPLKYHNFKNELSLIELSLRTQTIEFLTATHNSSDFIREIAPPPPKA